MTPLTVSEGGMDTANSENVSPLRRHNFGFPITQPGRHYKGLGGTWPHPSWRRQLVLVMTSRFLGGMCLVCERDECHI